ncbi:MAG TPA: DUF1343 domain-containing protein [Candidatus Marinimicrobia bacterium]|nr:DUF1343 domain-containing protein [Candidatus Neomarinimicrobiota bacterium]
MFQNTHKKSLFIFNMLIILFAFPASSSGSARDKIAVKTGLDVVVENQFSAFAGKRVGIVCNHTARDKNGEHIVDLFHESGVCEVTAIFGPEHGFRGMHADGQKIHNEKDEVSGATIYSLYGKIRKPTTGMLNNVDVLVYDIQDVGARFYTYIATMSLAMASAAENNIPFVILDRPNPIRGDRIEGPLLDMKFKSFVGPHPIPIRYRMTIGELALWINGEGLLDEGLSADLTVIKTEGWQRQLWYDEIDLPWIAPSPNMKHLGTAIVYPGFCLLEGSNLSEGRGTDDPFMQFGAPWINAEKYAAELNALGLEGIVFHPVTFTPVSISQVAYRPKYENQKCCGVRVEISDRNRFKPVRSMLLILEKTKKLYPENFSLKNGLDRLYGSDELRLTLNGNAPVEELINSWDSKLSNFREQILQYLLYE